MPSLLKSVCLRRMAWLRTPFQQLIAVWRHQGAPLLARSGRVQVLHKDGNDNELRARLLFKRSPKLFFAE